jgi:predicted RNase H-like nuclease
MIKANPMNGERYRVMGVDACRAGWVGIVLCAGESSAYVESEIEDLAAAAERDGPLDAIAVDMPIGLPDAGRRAADMLVRQALGPRWATVFITPVRAALGCDDYKIASTENRRAAGEGISQQAFALRHKIRQVDRWIRHTDYRVVEVHPELTFARLAGEPLQHSKSTWNGTAQRRHLLAGAGIRLADDLGTAGATAGVADVLDAAAAAWTALGVAQGRTRPTPDPPETFSDGLPAAIWS